MPVGEGGESADVGESGSGPGWIAEGRGDFLRALGVRLRLSCGFTWKDIEMGEIRRAMD